MCVKSATAQSGLCFFNSSSFAPPVATASVFAPMNFPQRTSNGVSPDHNDFLRLQNFPQHAAATFQCGGGDVVTFLVIVGKSAELELVPQPEMAQLDFRTKPDVAGEQAEHRRLGRACRLWINSQTPGQICVWLRARIWSSQKT